MRPLTDKLGIPRREAFRRLSQKRLGKELPPSPCPLPFPGFLFNRLALHAQGSILRGSRKGKWRFCRQGTCLYFVLLSHLLTLPFLQHFRVRGEAGEIAQFLRLLVDKIDL